jgi:hypothetical protein
VEDVFSCTLYKGNGSTQTITNGIDLSGEGGLVWGKARNLAGNHYWVDTARGAPYGIRSSTTGAQTTSSSTEDVTAFNSNGFSLGIGNNSSINNSGEPTVSWTFRKAEKFFDVVTYTGNGSSARFINHNLGSAPGFIVVKRTDSTSDWYCYHTATTGIDNYLLLNTTAAKTFSAEFWGQGSPNTTQFGISSTINVNGGTYVAYLFAHDAGGFGDSGSESVIKCGSFTTDGSGNATVDLGWEPQWLLHKSTNDAWNWFLWDTMRGWDLGSANYLYPNLSNAETNNSGVGNPTATGFTMKGFGASKTHIYIAIRRGPMKTPTTGTSVFAPALATGNPRYLTNFVTDLTVQDARDSGSNGTYSRLTGTNALRTTSTDAEFASSWAWDLMNGSGPDFSSTNYIGWNFRRAPGFFDVVCYTGNGTGTADDQIINHNLTVTPEMIICKNRTSSSTNWIVYHEDAGDMFYTKLNLTDDKQGYYSWSANSTKFNANRTSSLLNSTNHSGENYIAYLFATLAGVSKVGSYTGTGTTLQVNCGFTGGARFVLIKRTDSTGDWYVWDTARGIVSGNDPYLLLNSTDAEVTNTDYIDTYSSGFEISSTAPAAINANGGTFIFLAIA